MYFAIYYLVDEKNVGITNPFSHLMGHLVVDNSRD